MKYFMTTVNKVLLPKGVTRRKGVKIVQKGVTSFIDNPLKYYNQNRLIFASTF